MDKPKISFCLPTYNRIAWIAESIESLRQQTLKEIEIIVVDDCSTDSTQVLIEWFKQKDSRIKYVRNEVNLGAGLSRNVGNQIALADIICVADSDDYYPNYRAEETYKFLTKNKKIDIVNGSYNRVDYSNNITEQFKATTLKLKDFNAKKPFQFCHPATAYRRKDILELPYRKEDGATDDFQLVTDWLNAGKTFKGVGNIWCFHRILPESIMTKMRGNIE